MRRRTRGFVDPRTRTADEPRVRTRLRKTEIRFLAPVTESSVLPTNLHEMKATSIAALHLSRVLRTQVHRPSPPEDSRRLRGLRDLVRRSPSNPSQRTPNFLGDRETPSATGRQDASIDLGKSRVPLTTFPIRTFTAMLPSCPSSTVVESIEEAFPIILTGR